MAEDERPRQHRVPKCMLRRWSKDGRSGEVARWDRKTRRYYRRKGIKDFLAERGYYDNDNREMEGALSQLESQVSRILDVLTKHEVVPSKRHPAYEFLCGYMTVQVGRTDTLGNLISDFVEKAYRTAGSMVIQQQTRQKTERDQREQQLLWAETEIVVDQQRSRCAAVGASYEARKCLQDLGCTLLISPNERMVLPDTGAWRQNILADDGDIPWDWSSIGAVGVLPVSKWHCLVWWDPRVYRWAERVERGAEIRTMTEVEEGTLARTALTATERWATLHEQPSAEEWIRGAEQTLRTTVPGNGYLPLTVPGLETLDIWGELKNNPMYNEQARLNGIPARPTASMRKKAKTCS